MDNCRLARELHAPEACTGLAEVTASFVQILQRRRIEVAAGVDDARVTRR